MLHSDAGRRVLATLHGAAWHRHIELVVAGRQRSITHQPAHQGVFEGARHPAPPHVASVIARLEPTRFSPLARVGNGTGRAQVPVSTRTARHDRAHSVRSRPRSHCTSVHHWVHSQILGVRSRQKRPFRAPPVMDQLACTRFFLICGPSLTVEQFFWWVLEPASALKALARQPIVIFRVVCARA